MSGIDFIDAMTMHNAPVAVNAIPSTWKGNPLTHERLPTVRALRVHAESKVCEAPITQMPTATVTKQRIKVTARFMALVYHRDGSCSWQFG
jgi:hypothetical protein